MNFKMNLRLKLGLMQASRGGSFSRWRGVLPPSWCREWRRGWGSLGWRRGIALVRAVLGASAGGFGVGFIVVGILASVTMVQTSPRQLCGLQTYVPASGIVSILIMLTKHYALQNQLVTVSGRGVIAMTHSHT